MQLENHLHKFAAAHRITESKGALCIVVVLTRNFSRAGFPLNSADHVTEEKGQVKGLGKAAVQKILGEHGITRVLAEEGGRTSRGSMGLMQAYLAQANALHAAKLWDPQTVEAWWIERVRLFFDTKPFKMRLDPSKSVRTGLRDLFTQIQKRQKESGGTMFMGTVFQHLVGAKLEIVIGKAVLHHAHSTADAPTGRSGDFLIDNTAIHVTTAPGEALIRKCITNLVAGVNPIIITTTQGCIAGELLAGGDAERIEFIDIEQFLTANIHEWGKFDTANRRVSLERLIQGYNLIVNTWERTPGLAIELQ
jgi:hypothetical protein